MKERILYHACEASISYGSAVYHIAKRYIIKDAGRVKFLRKWWRSHNFTSALADTSLKYCAHKNADRMRNNMYEKLFELAQKSLENLEQKIEGLPAPQVTVLLTDLDHYYVAVNDVDGAICETLKQAKDTKVLRMLTMWKDGCIDLPSMKF